MILGWQVVRVGLKEILSIVDSIQDAYAPVGNRKVCTQSCAVGRCH